MPRVFVFPIPHAPLSPKVVKSRVSEVGRNGYELEVSASYLHKEANKRTVYNPGVIGRPGGVLLSAL